MTARNPAVRPPAPVCVAIALLWRAGRLLVALRPAGAIEAGAWEFPGGKVEPGETPAAALARELTEELGIAAAIGPLAWQTDVPRTPRALCLLFFHVYLPQAACPRPLAADALAWHAPAELLSLPFCSADRELIEALVAGKVAMPRQWAERPD